MDIKEAVDKLLEMEDMEEYSYADGEEEEFASDYEDELKGIFFSKGYKAYGGNGPLMALGDFLKENPDLNIDNLDDYEIVSYIWWS